MFISVHTEAANSEDKLCCQLFYDAGYQLGRHVMALLPQVDEVGVIHSSIGGTKLQCYNTNMPCLVEVGCHYYFYGDDCLSLGIILSLL